MKRHMPELAFDKSVRHFDVDGRLHVAVSHISKAMVCPYLGSEIPEAEALGLDAGKVYMLLRDPQELERAAPTFRNLPLLIQHVPVSAAEPRKDLVVGSTGSDVEFNAPYLSVSLSVWDAPAIAGIESKDQTELSSAYRYTADMTPGVYEGTAYDGVMRNIVGNHVALVDVGRAGPDVVVSDRNPFIKGTEMTKKQRLIAAKTDARKALEGKLAQDADLSLLDKLIERLAMDEDKDDDKKKVVAEDESDDDEEGDSDETKAEKAKRRAAKLAADEEEAAKKDDKKPEVTKAAMDSAIAVAVDAATKKVRYDMEALHVARREVSPMVGEVALDSAEAVYKFALDHAKVDTEGVHPSAYRALVRMAGIEKVPAPRVAMDASVGSSFAERFPTAGKPTRS